MRASIGKRRRGGLAAPVGAASRDDRLRHTTRPRSRTKSAPPQSGVRGRIRRLEGKIGKFQPLFFVPFCFSLVSLASRFF